eukprot:gene25716-31055_t
MIELSEIHGHSRVFWTLINPFHCSLTLTVLSGLRLIMLFRLAIHYQQNYRIRGTAGLSLLLLTSLVACLLRIKIIYFAHERLAAILILCSHLFSFYCHIICARHLLSSIDPTYRTSLGVLSQLKQQSATGDRNSSSAYLKAKGSWRKQMDTIQSFTRMFTGAGSSVRKTGGQDLLEVFDEILLLYSGNDKELEEVITCLRLRLNSTAGQVSSKASARNSAPESLLFFLPCLLNFFVYGSFEHENRVRELILDISNTELSACLAIYCYLFARRPTGGIDQDSIASFLQSIEARGNKACESLLNPHPAPLQQQTLYEEEQECKSLLPLPSPHVTYPLNLCRLPPRGPIFSSVLEFWGEMAGLSTFLSSLPLRDRRAQLSDRLSSLVQTYLPSPFLVVPTDPHMHRLYHIHVEECRAFRTGGRAPLLLVCEVVYISHQPPIATNRSSKWWEKNTSSSHQLTPNPRPHPSFLSYSQSEDSLVDFMEAPPPSPSSALPLPTRYSTFHTPSPLKKVDSGLGQWSSPTHPMSPQPRNLSSNPVTPISPLTASVTSSPPTVPPSPMSPTPQNPVGLEDRPITPLSKSDRNTVESAREDSTGMGEEIVYKEKWKDKAKRLRLLSPVGHLPGWRLLPIIVKAQDDLRQEELICQLISFMHNILNNSSQTLAVRSFLRPYRVMALSRDYGIVEAIPDTVSLDMLKKEMGYGDLMHFFTVYFGDSLSPRYKQAQQNFIFSLAQYSVLCYLLSLRDRHNGNILLTTHGHLVHIDYGFVLGASPGGNMEFEQAPFKLTTEYVEIMGGVESRGFKKFRDVCLRTFMELRKHSQRIMLLLEMLSKGSEHLACFAEDPQRVMAEMHARFFPDMHDRAAASKVDELIHESLDHWSTSLYDQFQRCCVGIQ